MHISTSTEIQNRILLRVAKLESIQTSKFSPRLRETNWQITWSAFQRSCNGSPHGCPHGPNTLFKCSLTPSHPTSQRDREQTFEMFSLRAFPESPPLAIHSNISCRHMNKAIFTTHLDSLQEIILRCLPFDLIPQWLQSLSHSLLPRSYSFLKENNIYCRKLFRMCSCRLNTSYNEPFTELGVDLQFYIFKSLYFSSCTLSLFWDCYNRRQEGGKLFIFLNRAVDQEKKIHFLTAIFSSADYTDRTFMADFPVIFCIQLHLCT